MDKDEMILSNAILINPTRTIEKNSSNPFIAMEDIEPNYRFVKSKTNRESRSGSKFKNGDTLFARITPSLENGKTAYVDSLEDGKIGIGSTEFIVLSGKPGITENLFVYYLARTSEFRNAAIQSMTGTSGRQRVQETVFDNFEMEIPDINNQLKISNILGNLDNKIKNLRDTNLILEQIIQTLFKSWFIDFDGQTEFEDSELGKIPKGWTIGNLNDIAEFRNGKFFSVENYNKHGKIPVFGSNGQIGNTEKVLNENPVVVIGRVGAYCGSLYRIDQPSWTTDNSIVVEPKNSDFEFLFYKLCNIDLRQNIGGSAQPLLTQSGLQNISTVIPPFNLQIKFGVCIYPLSSKINLQKTIIEKLSKIRDSLLPKLMAGEIRV